MTARRLQITRRVTVRIAAFGIGTLAASAGAIALAEGPSPSIGGSAFGSGGLIGAHSIVVHLSHRDGFFMGSGIVPPGATFGWHSHRTPVAVAVTAGTLTLYDSSGAKCTATRYKAGQGFIEPANHIHLARNEGKARVILYATYIGVPPRLQANPALLDVFNQPRPRKCPASVH
jgi:quercetin dioxygenase-like cupin family protein